MSFGPYSAIIYKLHEKHHRFAVLFLFRATFSGVVLVDTISSVPKMVRFHFQQSIIRHFDEV